jgi:lipoprotein-anchoring transpeptidase ErfK/SrfK
MMIRSLLTTTALGLAVLSPSQAAVRFEPEQVAAPFSAPRSMQLAQNRNVDVVYDQRGRPVLIDRLTGEVVGVLNDPALRRRGEPEPSQSGGYRLDDPADMERFRRDREILLGRREPPAGRSVEDYINNPDLQDEPAEGRNAARYPDAPVDRNAPPPRYGDISRQPLDGAGIPDAGDAPADVLRGGRDAAVLPDNQGTVSPESTGTVARTEEIEEQPDGAGTVVPPGGGSVVGQNETRENVARIQILLDRRNLSPGVIDGRMGDNVNKAISAYRAVTGHPLRTYDKESIEKELEETGGPALVDYTIQPEDAAGPFVASVPEDYSQKAKLDRLGYTSVEEMLGERFHMDVNYLRALNPGANFSRPGTIIKVANTGRNATGKVARIEADKAQKQVRAYDASGRLVAVYPATIGSAATPSPSGTHTVERVALDPEYTYNPKINFKQGDNDKVLTIPPGPNGPVGTVWIALSKPTYGIHGTPEPSKIGKTESNGCIRLTNWDAQELAKLVEKGVTVEFVD